MYIIYVYTVYKILWDYIIIYSSCWASNMRHEIINLKTPELQKDEITLPLINDGCAVTSPPDLVKMVENGESQSAKFTVSRRLKYIQRLEGRRHNFSSEFCFSICWLWYSIFILPCPCMSTRSMSTGKRLTWLMILSNSISNYILESTAHGIYTIHREGKFNSKYYNLYCINYTIMHFMRYIFYC